MKLDQNTLDKKFIVRNEADMKLKPKQMLSDYSHDLNIPSRSSRVNFEGINESNPTKFNGQQYRRKQVLKQKTLNDIIREPNTNREMER